MDPLNLEERLITPVSKDSLLRRYDIVSWQLIKLPETSLVSNDQMVIPEDYRRLTLPSFRTFGRDGRMVVYNSVQLEPKLVKLAVSLNAKLHICSR